jgi:hypothetical protein
VKVVAVMVAAFMGPLNVLEIVVLTATVAARFAGTVETTVGEAGLGVTKPPHPPTRAANTHATKYVFLTLKSRNSFSSSIARKASLIRSHSRRTFESSNFSSRVLAPILIECDESVTNSIWSKFSLEQAQAAVRAELLGTTSISDSIELQSG